MLISCPECGHSVSDKAISCPVCGYPMNLPPAEKKPAKRAGRLSRNTKKYKKLPNGFGSIQKLSGNRARPYAAYPPTLEFSVTGSPVRRPALGYYKDWHEAYAVLADYNKLTEQEREAQAQKLANKNFTFAEVYELYRQEKFRKEISEGKKTSMMYSMACAFNNSAVLHDKIYSDLDAKDFQDVIDSCSFKHSTKELLLTLYKQMSRFAIAYNYSDKDCSLFIAVKDDDDDENGQPFTLSDIKKLWADREDPVSQIILIMIFSGYRIAAYKTMELNFEHQYFKGGVKTKSAKNRIVPFHSFIAPFISPSTFSGFDPAKFRNDCFYPKLKQLGISATINGIKHTPHDTRHTFSWLCDKYGVDEITKHLLMGHTMSNDVERSKYAHRTFEELQAAMEKIQPDLSLICQ